MTHKHKPEQFAAYRQARKDFEAHKLANPSPNSVPQILARVKLLEALLGV